MESIKEHGVENEISQLWYKKYLECLERKPTSNPAKSTNSNQETHNKLIKEINQSLSLNMSQVKINPSSSFELLNCILKGIVFVPELYDSILLDDIVQKWPEKYEFLRAANSPPEDEVIFQVGRVHFL